MTAREKLEQFLQTYGIQGVIPTEMQDDSYNAILAVCKKMIEAKPALLSLENSKNFKTLMKVAQDGLFFTGPYNGGFSSRRPACFQEAIELLAEQIPSALNQISFEGLCRITTANLAQEDISFAAQCFIHMSKANLLTPKNTHNLVQNIINAPLRVPNEVSRANLFKNWLSACPWITQDEFNLGLDNSSKLEMLSSYMQKLNETGLNTAANCQALLDSRIEPYQIFSKTQEEFNRSLLESCDEKLKILIRETNKYNLAPVVYSQAIVLCKKLKEIRKSPETQTDPKNLLHILNLVLLALPTASHKPTKADVQNLMQAGLEAEDKAPSLWKALGIMLMFLATAIAVTMGVVLTVEVSASLALAGGSIAVVSALGAGGFFAYKGAQAHVSKNIIDLAETIQDQRPGM